MMLHSPFLMTAQEAAVAHKCYPGKSIQFNPNGNIAEWDYASVLKYVKSRRSGTVCLRYYVTNAKQILSLPLTKDVILLIYVFPEDSDKHMLGAATILAAGEMTVREVWRAPFVSDNCSLYPAPTLN